MNIFKKILCILFFSCLVSQGMYIDKGAITVYSLNLDIHSISNDYLDTKDDYLGIGLSSVLKGRNEYCVNYQKKEKFESIESLYNYYIKPDFYLKMRYGVSYKFIKSYNDAPNTNEYSTRLLIYGNSKNKNSNALKFYPMLSYEYFIVEDDKHDVWKLGLSILFNDIGVEPSFSYISKDITEFSIKLYLWEFNSY